MIEFFRSPLRFPKTWGLLLAISVVATFVTGNLLAFVVQWGAIAACSVFLNLITPVNKLRSLGVLPRVVIVLAGLGMIAWGVTGLLGMHGSVTDIMHAVFHTGLKSLQSGSAFLDQA